jgi:hypothetical protein
MSLESSPTACGGGVSSQSSESTAPDCSTVVRSQCLKYKNGCWFNPTSKVCGAFADKPIEGEQLQIEAEEESDPYFFNPFDIVYHLIHRLNLRICIVHLAMIVRPIALTFANLP